MDTRRVEVGVDRTLDELHRLAVRAELHLSRLLDHLGLPDVTDDEVDAALDEQKSSLS